MAFPLLIGIDLGTSKIVSLAVDPATGEIVASHSCVNDADVTRQADRQRGRSEWDADKIVLASCKCLKGLADRLDHRVADVRGIGITGQQHGMLLVDSKYESCTPLINWQDRRGLECKAGEQKTYLELARQRIGEGATQRTGCRLQPGFMALTLMWLRIHDALPRGTRACFVMDYFAHRLTGQPPITDPTCAASAGVLDVRTRQWDRESIESLGLELELFPEVREANQPVGTLSAAAAQQSGFPQGTPVFVPIGDHQASFLGSVHDRATTALLNVGTGAQVAAFTNNTEFRPPLELRPFPVDGNLLSNVGLAGGWSYQVLEEFFRDVGRQFFEGNQDPRSTLKLFDAMNQLAESVEPGAAGLECIPLFHGARANAQLRGSLTGISPQNFTAAHLCRALLEGMAANYRAAYEQIEPFLVAPHEKFAGAGNGLRSNSILFAAVQKELCRPVLFPRHREEAAFGAAIIASVASGVFKDVPAASQLVRYETS